MASSKEYLEFILGQLSELEEITYRAIMGEFIIYYRGKIVGEMCIRDSCMTTGKRKVGAPPACISSFKSSSEMFKMDAAINPAGKVIVLPL